MTGATKASKRGSDRMASWVAVACGGRVAAQIDIHRSGSGRFERRKQLGAVHITTMEVVVYQ
jgi:hypothetical protein